MKGKNFRHYRSISSVALEVENPTLENLRARFSDILWVISRHAIQSSNDRYRAKLFALEYTRFENKEQFSQALLAIFAERWNENKLNYSIKDLFDKKDRKNFLFVHVAQFLIINKLVPLQHYYDVLMPTVKNFEEQIGIDLESVRDQKLENLFLTDDDYLVNVQHLIEIASATQGKILVTSPKGFRALSQAEWHRIHNIEHFREGLRAVIEKFPRKNTGLTRQTVEAVWQLACGITYQNGGGRSYNLKEQVGTDASGGAFIMYLETLLERERSALMSYYITRPDGGEGGKTFGEVLHLMTKGNTCTHMVGKYCFKLAYDFLRDFRYTNYFTTLEEVRDLQKKWSAREPEVLDFVSRDDFSDSPAQQKAHEHLFVLLQHMQSRKWNEPYENVIIVPGRGGVKVPALLFKAVRLLEAAEKAPQTDWERLEFNIVRMFTQVAKQPKTFLYSAEEYAWYRCFLKNDFFKNLLEDFYGMNNHGAMMLNY